MSNVRSKNTKPEMLVRKFLFSRGYRYRINKKDLPGKPDIVLSKYKTVIFVNGCFWHGHENCRYSKIPESNREFWLSKISKNVERDNVTRQKLTELGWKVIDVWQCQLKAKVKDATLNKLIILLNDE